MPRNQPKLDLYPPDVAFTPEEFADWAETLTWTPAKTTPDQPHWYWAPPSQSDTAFRSAWELIRTTGTMRQWPAPGSNLDGKVRPRPYAYLVVGEWEYWRAPTYLLNRARPGRLN